jgi:putative salt-induced outer membrane protein YdiY
VAPVPAVADEVRLANGDRITGRVVSLAGSTLTLSTDHGDLRIPWNAITALTVDESVLVTVSDGEPTTATIAPAADAGHATLTPGTVLPLADITAISRPAPTLVIDGGANAGFVSSGGNTEVNNLRLDGDILARAGDNRYSISAAITRAEDNDVETVRHWSGAFKYDRFVSSRLFVNANSIFTNDRFRELDLRTAIGAGIGYQIIETPAVTLTADAGIGWVHEDLASEPDGSYTAARESTALTVTAFPGRVQVFHQHDSYLGMTGDDNLFVRMQNGVRITLAAGFVTTLRLDTDYDRSPAPDRRNTDQTFSLTLGYRF